MKTLAVLVLVVLSVVVGRPAHAADTSEDPYRGTTGWRPSTIMWGDSITRRNEPGFRASGWTGEIDAVSGRSVEKMLPLVRERVRSRSRITVAVINLGFNGGGGTVTQWHYRESVRLIKKHSPRARVVVIAPYRDATWWDHLMTAERARWASEVTTADTRSVCLADWAGVVQAEDLLDGLHPDELGVGGSKFVRTVMEPVRGTCR